MNAIERYILLVVLVMSFSWGYSQKIMENENIPIFSSQEEVSDSRIVQNKAWAEKDYFTYFNEIRGVRDYFFNYHKYDSLIAVNNLIYNRAMSTDSVDIAVNAALVNSSVFKMTRKVDKSDSIIWALDEIENLSIEAIFTIKETKSSIFSKQGRDDEARILLDEILVIAKEYGNKLGECNVYRSYATIDRKELNYVSAIQNLLKAEEVLEDENDFVKAQVYRGIGDLFFIIDDVERSMEYYQKGLDLAIKNDHKIILHELKGRIGGLELKRENYVDARKYLKESVEYYRKRGFENETFSIMLKIAEAWDGEGNDLELQKSIDTLNSLYTDKLWDVFKFRYYGFLGNIAFNKGDLLGLKKQIKNIETFVTISDDTNSKLKLKKLKWKLAEMENNKVLAGENAIAYYQLKDSLDLANSAYRAQFLESEFNREEQKAEIATLAYQNELKQLKLVKRNQWLLFGGIALLVMLGLLAVVYQLFRKNQKNKLILAEQNTIISKALEEKNVLLKEIHHRVKNNLQVISSLLSLQSRKVDDPSTKQAIREGRNRVKSMALIHQNLYQDEDLVGVSTVQYIEKLTNSLVNSYSMNRDQIEISTDIDEMKLDVDTVIPLGLILNELISNSLKYAFNDEERGKISISLKKKEEAIELQVSDNGVGLPESFSIETLDSLGFKLIKSFTDKLKAKLDVSSLGGTRVNMLIPITKPV